MIFLFIIFKSDFGIYWMIAFAIVLVQGLAAVSGLYFWHCAIRFSLSDAIGRIGRVLGTGLYLLATIHAGWYSWFLANEGLHIPAAVYTVLFLIYLATFAGFCSCSLLIGLHRPGEQVLTAHPATDLPGADQINGDWDEAKTKPDAQNSP